MESRKITVVSTVNHIKKTIMSGAETLGQLKADFDANDIEYKDMTFYEGLSKTELISDDSILPKDINYRGVVTNDLVFMLTYSNKKIKSGSIEERKMVYETIKRLNLQDRVKEIYGKPFTMVKTAELNKVINNNTAVPVAKETKESDKDVTCDNLLNAFEILVHNLHDNEYISNNTYSHIMDTLYADRKKCFSDIESPYSDAELDDMFEDFK